MTNLSNLAWQLRDSDQILMLHHHFGRIFQKRMLRKVWSCDAGQEDLKLKKKVKKKLRRKS